MNFLKVVLLVTMLTLFNAPSIYARTQAERDLDALLESIEREERGRAPAIPAPARPATSPAPVAPRPVTPPPATQPAQTTPATPRPAPAPRPQAPRAPAVQPVQPVVVVTEALSGTRYQEFAQEYIAAFPNNEIENVYARALDNLRMARQYFTMRNFLAANQRLDQVLNSNFINLFSEVFLLRGHIAQEQSRIRALENFARSIFYTTGNITILNPEITFEEYMRAGGVDYSTYVKSAVEVLTRLTSPDSRVPAQHKVYYFFFLGYAHKELGDIDSALEAFRRSIRLLGIFSYAHASSARALQLRPTLSPMESSNAIGYIDRAISLAPSNAAFHNIRGEIIKSIRSYHRAIDDFTRAISFAPAMPRFYLNRSLSQTRINAHRAAQRDLLTFTFLTEFFNTN